MVKPASCKAKGRRLQQAVRDDLLDAFPTLTADDVRSTSMGAGGEDVLLSTAARRFVPLSFEAKNCERLNVFAALEQAEGNAGGHTPCVVFKKNRTRTYAALPWPCLVRLLQAASRGAGQGDERGAERGEANATREPGGESGERKAEGDAASAHAITDGERVQRAVELLWPLCPGRRSGSLG
jgi:hypothetical protein